MLKIILPIVTISGNVLQRMHFRERMKLKVAYGWELIAVGAKDEAYQVEGKEKRKVTFISYRKKLCDYDRLVQGFSVLLDCLEDMKLIFMDSPKYLISTYEQFLDPVNPRTEIMIEKAKEKANE